MATAAKKKTATPAKAAKAPAKAAKAPAKAAKAPAKAAKVPAKAAPPAKAQAAAKAAPQTTTGPGTRATPWALKTAPGTSAFAAFCDPTLDPPALVVQVGSTELRYHLRCLDDLVAMLKQHGDWMALGGADEQKPAADGTVEAWGRSPKNPVGGWYGLKKGLRGRFGVYVPPVLEALGRVELEHQAKNNRVRAR